MAINKKLIHFKSKLKFEEELANGNILETSIVFILDTKEIYTHGQLYDGSTFDPTNIEDSIENIINNKADKSDLDAILDGTSVVAKALNDANGNNISETYAIKEEINNKQDKLVSGTNIKTINGESILGSGNIVISGGSSSNSSGAYSLVNHGTSDTTFTLTPNCFHVWGEVTTLDLDFGTETEGIANEFLFQFTSGSTATSLSLPDNIKWTNEEVPTVEANMIYQVSVLKGMASMLGFINLLVFPIALLEGDNGKAGAALYEYLYNNYGETTSTITEEIYNPLGSRVSQILYEAYFGYIGYWMNFVSENINFCLLSSGYVSRINPIPDGGAD